MKKLERSLELPAVIAISISAMLGSGVFVLPGLAVAKTGPSVWLAYIVAGLFVLPAALSKAELATAMPTSGGSYVYLDRAFGPLTGTIAGLGLWLSLLLKSSFALVGFSAYLLVIADVPIRATAMVLLAGIVVLNIRGIGKVSKVQVVVVALSLLGLAGLSISGAGSFDSVRLEGAMDKGAWGFFSAVGFVFVSFAGVTKIAAIAEEIKRPNRNLPLGILFSLLIVTLIYGAVNLVLVGVVPMDQLSGNLKPIHTLAERVSDIPAIGIAAAILGVVTMTSMANAGLLAASRFPLAMSRDHLLPPALKHLHSRFLTPTASILLSGGAMAAAILLFDIERIAKLASAFMIMIFIAVNVSLIVLREKRVQWYQPGFRSPLYPWMQIFGIVTGLGLLVVMGPMSILAIVGIALPGALLFFTYGAKRTDRLGVMVQRGRRQELLTDDEPSEGQAHAEVETEATTEASVVVVLFGQERSPETLVDLANSLADGGLIAVFSITELPEQTITIADGEPPGVISIRRRIRAMARAEDINLEFSALTSHDVLRTVNGLASHQRCEWLVMEVAGRARASVTISNPLGWLKDHLQANLANFHDAGVRYIRKILVHVVPGPHDALVIGTADHLARVHGAQVTFVRFARNGATPEAIQCQRDYLDQVRQLTDAPSDTLLLRGRSEERTIAQATASYDLLVTAGVPHPGWYESIRGSSLDRITERAACSVLRLQAPRQSTHATFETYCAVEDSEQKTLADFIHPQCTGARLEPMKKEALFSHFAATFAKALPEFDEGIINEALWAREATQNTAIGRGIALPHATLPAPHTYLGVFTTRGEINYDAPDGKPVDVFFVTLGPPSERNTHLRLLGQLSSVIIKTDLLDRLRAAKSSAKILVEIRACEAEFKRS